MSIHRVFLRLSMIPVLLQASAATAQESLPELIVHTTLRPPNEDIYLIEGPGREPERVTDHPALDYNAAFSPDGRWLVFTSDRGGNTDLYALDLEEGGDPVRLTHHPAMDDAADISPDGKRIAFVSTRDGNADIFTMPFAPGEARAEDGAENLTRRPGGDFNPVFSPDGAKIAWTRGLNRFMTDVSVMNSDGSEPRRLAGGETLIAGSPAWSGDGDGLYFHGLSIRGLEERSRRGLVTRVWHYDLANGELEPITPPEFAAFSPAVSPEGRVAFDRTAGPLQGRPFARRARAVQTARPDGSGLQTAVDSTRLAPCLAPAFDDDGRLACHGPGPIGDMPIMANGRPFLRPGAHRTVSLPDRELRVIGIRGYFPDFLPDGRLVYGEWLNDEGDLAEYGMPPLVTSLPDGTGRTVVFHDEDHQPWATSACEDGSWIAFNDGPTFAPAGEDVDIWKVRPDGTDAVNLTPESDANDAFPAWSSDCEALAFRSGRDGDKEIYVMDADGRHTRRITHREGVETVPALSPRGDWIAFSTDRDGAGMKIWIQRLDGSEGRFLEPGRAGTPGIDMHPRFSPDGEWVVFVSDRGGLADELLLSEFPQPYGDIWAVSVKGGEPVRLTDDKWEDGLPRWGRMP